MQWFRKAADKDYASAMFSLGVMYADGRGVTQSDTQAVEWYRKAAAKDYAAAMYNLGVMYANGQGVAQSDAQAIEWYGKAARAGHEKAKNLLRKMGLSW